MPTSFVNTIYEDGDGNTWYTYDKKLHKATAMPGRAKMQVTSFSVEDGLPHSFIYSIQEDGKGRIWLCTKMGLSCFHKGKFNNFDVNDGLADNACYFLLEDDGGDLWVGSLKGINRIDGKSLKIHMKVGELDFTEICQNSYLKDSNGYIWFGTNDGVTCFDPGKIVKKDSPLPAHITGVKAFEESLPIKDNFVLEHDQNYIRFSFKALYFSSPEDVRYVYRLSDLDSEWQETRERTAAYPYLPPGKYTFSVTTGKNKEPGANPVTSIHFVILPPFYKTWWFITLLSAVLLFLLFAAVKLFNKRTKEKIIMKERNRQLVMAQKMELVGILAAGAVHDLKNLLAIIIDYSKRAARRLDEEDRNDSPIEKIQATARTAVQVARQIMAFSRKKDRKNRIANLPDLLEDILDTLKIKMPGDIRIVLEKSSPEIPAPINPTQFQQMVMNLCLNAADAMPNGGDINISLYTGENNAFLDITDTGTGMDETTLKKLFDPLFTTKQEGKGTGLGLFVVREIVQEHRGSIDVQSRPGEGTTFRISLPQS
ncbi:MAG: hypothetical protein GY765_35655 [bacterium]|nr:hypothetical protein [bacterium]